MNLKKMNKIRGEVTVPGDKSVSHRGVMLGALSDGITEISGFLTGADCLSTIDCFRTLGINTEVDGTDVRVYGQGLYGLKKPENILYTGNSGTTTRLLCGILAAQSFDSQITGDSSICKRPMSRVVKPLTQMNAKIDGDYCPLTIHGGELCGIKYQMPVASAQVKTAILLAGLYANGETEVIETEKSRDHTERMLSAMGADIVTEGLSVRVRKSSSLNPIKIAVPGDISSAAFFIAAATVMKGSEVLIRNVGVNPTRTGILDAARAMGADICEQNYRIENNEPVADLLVKSADLKGTVIDGAIIPRLIDELPIIAVMALAAEGETVIADAAELKVKETNRIAAVCTELKKCGADI
ncbi:MAG: 3-phosphoshikimate 1-carboxyvinyltransferase, partial [Clostridia bacterium]|nr:3-phosphoshikimate 1-carboxyvinyltransferase [Clostridia bacterium]